MLEIEVKDKFFDILDDKAGKIRAGVVSVVGLVLTVLTYFLYNNLMATFTVGFACFIVIFFIISPPKKFKIRIDDDKLFIDKKMFRYENFDSWAVIDFGDTTELVMQKAGAKPTFYHFYIDEEENDVKALVVKLTQVLPYNSETGFGDTFHLVFRFFGLQ